MSPDAVRDAHTLAWRVPDHHAAVVGPGSPLQVVVDDVLGVPTSVFAQRAANMRAVLARAGEGHGDSPYLVFHDRTLSYADVVASASRLAAWLHREHGVAKGDRVAFAAANLPGHVVGWWAAASLGAIITGLNGWWTASELAYGVELTAPTVVLADPRHAALLAETAAPVVDLSAVESLLGPPRPDDPPLPTVDIDEDDPLIILFTSGTTGRPKGATLSHRTFVHAAMAGALSGATAAPPNTPPVPPPSRPPATLLPAPLFHISGSLPLSIAPAFGTTVVFPPPGRWDETTHLQLTQDHGISGWSAVPTQFWRLLEHPDFDRYDTSSVMTVGGGGAVYAPELYRLIREKLPHARIGTGYGMTETAGSGARLGGITLETHPASVGAVEPLCQLQIRDPDGTPLPFGEVGEIHIKGPSVFLGYWNDPEASRRVIDGERWYSTGDFGRIVDGVLYLESRMRDLIIRGGENIYPIEIENRLAEHPEIADACVVGVDHHQLGQEVAAAVVRQPDAAIDEAGIRAFVAERLAAFKVPVHIVFVDELPYTATGKVLKRDVEEIVAATVRS